jgi:hypothetical protein
LIEGKKFARYMITYCLTKGTQEVPSRSQGIGLKACPVDRHVFLWYITCMKPQRFTIYIDPSLLEQLKKVAKDNKRSANSEIIYAIEKHIEKQEKGK